MTVNEIKAQLPDVKVTIDGKTYTGKTSGRALKFACVTVNHPIWGAHHMEYSWLAIKRAVNSDTALSV